MKIEPRQAGSFLRNPGRVRAVLLHGEDEGLVRERGAALTKLVAGSITDPFQVADLDRDGWPRLLDEMTALSMMGGRRVVRVRDAADSIVDMLKSALASKGEALIVLEAVGLGRGKLRTFAEAHADVAALACYPEEGRALQDAIRGTLAEAGATADTEAAAWLADTLGGDRGIMRSELQKLALLAGAGGRIDIDTARDCTGDSAGASADTGLLAATKGDIAAADTEIERAVAEGLTGIALIRMALAHLQKMHLARLRMATGLSAADAVRTLRPPVFFKLVPSFTAGVSLWPEAALVRAIEDARQVEIACKQTGGRQELLVRRFVGALARQARQRKEGSASF